MHVTSGGHRPHFCLSINHPLLTSRIEVLGNEISPGTGDNWKPCINPGVLDAFLEQTWEFNRSATDEISVQKAASFKVISAVGSTACAAQGGSTCGQVNNPYNYPSMYDLNRTELIIRMEQNYCTPDQGCTPGIGHWISAASQPWGKLYGKFETTPGGGSLTEVYSFVFAMYQDIPCAQRAEPALSMYQPNGMS